VKSRDLFHLFGIWDPFHIQLFLRAKLNKKKIIISTLGALEPWSLEQKRLKKKLAWHLYQKKILNNCDYIHATSEDEKKHLEELGIKTPIKIIPHGVIIKSTKKIKKKEKQKKEALFFSRIHEKKGILELLNSWSIIKPADWILKIYGPVSDMNYMSKIKGKILELSLEDSVFILNPVFEYDQKEEVFLNSDCFLLPSKSENFGMSIVEALSYGVPVLTTEETPWKILKEIDGGKIIKFSQDNLTSSLKEITSMNDEELIAMGSRGRELLKKNYDINKIILDYIKFYKEVLNR
jgi:glycosyltransferase involved in cell wall biosynthesis